jgi:hypothetical protein
MSRIWSALHVCNVCAGCAGGAAPSAACDTSDAFVIHCRCRALLVSTVMIVMALYDSLSTIRQSQMDSRINECLAQRWIRKGWWASFIVSHYLFMQSISIPSLVGNLTIIVVFFVVSENLNVITRTYREFLSRAKEKLDSFVWYVNIFISFVCHSSHWMDYKLL